MSHLKFILYLKILIKKFYDNICNYIFSKTMKFENMYIQLFALHYLTTFITHLQSYKIN